MHEPKPGISSVLERYMTQPAQDLPPIPAPLPQPESDFYWEKCKANELWLRHCKSCDQAYFYPRDICPNCFSRDTDWIQSSGQGTLHTFSIELMEIAPIACISNLRSLCVMYRNVPVCQSIVSFAFFS